MADRIASEERSGREARCLFGIETEYGFAALGAEGERLDAATSAQALMHEVKRLVPTLPHSNSNDVFTANGSRVYIDSGLHPEVATPECTTPEEAVRFSRAGDRLLARAARALERASGGRLEAIVWKGNVDHGSAATWGSHESYLHCAPQQVLAEQLIPHLVTRIVYTGAGGFNNLAGGLEFVLSPRAFHLKHVVSPESTRERGIFHTRDEPLAGIPYRRLHVLAGESLWSQTADYLRVGTTALLVALVDAGRRPGADLEFVSPLEALATIATDVSGKATVRVRRSTPLSAVAIQRRLLGRVEAELGAGRLPAWAEAVCKRWRFVLDRLESAPSSLVGVLDWPTRLAVLKRQCEANSLAWSFSADATDPRYHRQPAKEVNVVRQSEVGRKLLEIDSRFNRLDEGGIFASLDRQEAFPHHIVSPDAIERAVQEPPAAGRARLRASWVKRLAGNGRAISCNWHHIVDQKNGKMLDLGDPFQMENESWRPIPSAPTRSTAAPDPMLEPIASAVTEGVPREALRQIRQLLAHAAPLPLSAYRYCAGVIDSFVPDVPIPILRPGAATAGPVLTAMFEHVGERGDYVLENRIGTLLYRFHEALGRYDLARRVVERLLVRAQATGDCQKVAVLTNNLGYEHFLASEWEVAAVLFERAIALFEDAGTTSEAPNAQANFLECRFEQIDPAHWHELAPVLRIVNRTLVSNRDWRARKTLRLLARFAEHRGHLFAARGWAKRTIAASEGVPTQLHEWDRAYFDALDARRGRQAGPARSSSSRAPHRSSVAPTPQPVGAEHT